MPKTECMCCGAETNDAVGIRMNMVKISLCRRCAEEVRRGLDGLGPDKCPSGKPLGYIRIESQEPAGGSGGSFLRVCGGTARRLKETGTPAAPAPMPEGPAIETGARNAKLGHLARDVELTEFSIPVLCTGVRYRRVFAQTCAQATQEAEREVEKDNRYSADALQDFKARALAPELMLEPGKRASWPYWGYGWHGTDGIDWRSYRTDKGPGSIPDIAEESWPVPPFED